jgi:hypothetical protein
LRYKTETDQRLKLIKTSQKQWVLAWISTFDPCHVQTIKDTLQGTWPKCMDFKGSSFEGPATIGHAAVPMKTWRLTLVLLSICGKSSGC